MGFTFVQQSLARVARWATLSTLALFTILLAGPLSAHSTREAIADLTVDGDRLMVEIYATWEPYVVGMDLDGLLDTNDSPLVAEYDDLRAKPDAALAAEIQSNWDRIAAGFRLTGAGPLELDRIEVDPEPDLTLPRDARVYASAPLNGDGSAISFGWVPQYGPLILRTTIGDETYAALLEGGEISAPIELATGVEETTGQMFVRFVIEGYEHIIPKGLDHILFVLGLFFFALRWRPILAQVTVFTLAHTVTFGLAASQVVKIPEDSMWLVESLIALSICFVAVENLLRPKLGWWRILVVFVFGLLHGLGFASVFGDLDLSPAFFLISLVAFNIGVEVGQLAVILAAFVLMVIAAFVADRTNLPNEETPAGSLVVTHRAVSNVGSIIIALIGLYWFVERIGLL